MKQSQFAVPMVFLSILAGVGFGVVIATQSPQPVTPADGLEVIDNPKLHVDLSEFVEADHSWQLVVLGYLHCPDVCPTTMAELRRLLDVSQQIALPVNVVFVSVDPGRDSSAEADEFARRFGNDFVGVTAPHNDLMRLTRQLGVGYRVPDEGQEYYLVTHSPVITIVDPVGRIRGRLRPGFDQERTRMQLEQLING